MYMYECSELQPGGGCQQGAHLHHQRGDADYGAGRSGVIVKFQSTRPLVANHQSVVAFLLAIGLRDQASNIAYRTLQTFCANGATRLMAIRMRPTKMERQPLVAEKFPPPKPRGEWYPRGGDFKPSRDADMQGDSK